MQSWSARCGRGGEGASAGRGTMLAADWPLPQGVDGRRGRSRGNAVSSSSGATNPHPTTRPAGAGHTSMPPESDQESDRRSGSVRVVPLGPRTRAFARNRERRRLNHPGIRPEPARRRRPPARRSTSTEVVRAHGRTQQYGNGSWPRHGRASCRRRARREGAVVARFLCGGGPRRPLSTTRDVLGPVPAGRSGEPSSGTGL